MRHASVFLSILVIVAATGATAGEYPAAVPHLEVRAWWPEQELANNTIHKLRVPRGGTIDVIATIDPAGVNLREPTVEITATPPLEITKLLVDGEAVEAANSTKVLLSAPRQLRWTFQLPWQVRKAEKEYRFDVTVIPAARRWRRGRGRSVGYNAPMKASVTVEQGVSCYDTTMTRRLEGLAASPYCKMEKIGKSVQGHEMYLLRVTDWSVPAEKKKQLIVIGPYHGDEAAGVETCLDFLHEIITDPARKHYLKKMVFYVVPSHNPDGHEMGNHWGTHDVDPGNRAYHKLDEVPEAANVKAMLDKYASEFTDALGLVHHQWPRDYTLISHLDNFPASDSASWEAVLNMSIQVSNDLDKPMYPIYSQYTDEGYTGVRGYMLYKLRIANYVLENTGHTVFNLADLMKSIVPELAMYYATIDQILEPKTVAPKPHPTKKVTFPPERNYKAYRVSTPPVIDGKLDEPCWAGETVIKDFKRLGRRGGEPLQTAVHVAYDDKNIYVAFKTPDLAEAPLPAGGSHPAPSGQDACEVMLDTNLNQWTYFQFITNANGAILDSYFRCAGIDDPDTYKAIGAKAAGSVESGAIELSIPLAAFNHPDRVDPPIQIPIPDGTVWGANFIRAGRDKDEESGQARRPESGWAQTRSIVHRPWEYNAITFMGAKSK